MVLISGYNGRMFERPLPRILIFLLIGIFIINAVATYFFWYWKIPQLDMVMHFSSGFWIGGIAIWGLFYGRGVFWEHIRTDKRIHIIALTLTAVFIIGILWEVFEYTLDYFAGRADYDIIDTASDLMFDLGGGFIAGLYFLKKEYNTQKIT